MRIPFMILAALTAAIPVVAQQKQETSKPGSGAGEPIAIHGHWLIEVRNPNGRLASRSEFENALTTGVSQGNDLLSALMTGAVAPGYWRVTLTLNTNPGLVSFTLNQSPGVCTVQNCNTGLNVATATGGTQLVLQGSYSPAAAAGTVAAVATSLLTCANTVSPSTCLAQNAADAVSSYTFTSATPPTISVLLNQIISVTVTLSFS